MLALASWEPVEPSECVANAFYAYENALMAAARALGRAVTKKHYEKVRLAEEMFSDNQLKTDVSDNLESLNDLRKDVQYGEPSPDVKALDLDDLVEKLEAFLNEVRKIVHGDER